MSSIKVSKRRVSAGKTPTRRFSSVKTPKRKAGAISGGGGARSGAKGRGSTARKRKNRRGADKWNVKPDDPDAKQLVEQVKNAASMLGMPKDEVGPQFYDKLKENVHKMIKELPE